MKYDPKVEILMCVGVLRAVFQAEKVNVHTINFLNYVVTNLPDFAEHDVEILNPIYANLDKISNMNFGIKMVHGLDVSSLLKLQEV
jgi:hypothetical protein